MDKQQWTENEDYGRPNYAMKMVCLCPGVGYFAPSNGETFACVGVHLADAYSWKRWHSQTRTRHTNMDPAIWNVAWMHDPPVSAEKRHSSRVSGADKQEGNPRQKPTEKREHTRTSHGAIPSAQRPVFHLHHVVCSLEKRPHLEGRTRRKGRETTHLDHGMCSRALFRPD